MRRERDDLRQDSKKQRLQISTLEELVENLELERKELQKKESLRLAVVTDTIQGAVEERIGAFLQSMPDCFPAGRYKFNASKTDRASELAKGDSPRRSPPPPPSKESAPAAASSETAELAESLDDDDDDDDEESDAIDKK